MKKIFSLYCLHVLLFASASYANVYEWTDGKETFTGTLAEYNAAAGAGVLLLEVVKFGPYPSMTLLDNILNNASELSASASNISQNLNDIDGSIDVMTSRDFDGVIAGLGGLVGGIGNFGSFSQTGPEVFGSDVPETLLTVLDPLTLVQGDLATTAIGTLQSGHMTAQSGKIEAWFNAEGLVSKLTTTVTTTATSTTTTAKQYGGIADTIAMQNVSVNSGRVDGSALLILADVNAKTGAIATTAIGALQSGMMEATVMGGLGTVSEHTSGIVDSLVGTTADPAR